MAEPTTTETPGPGTSRPLAAIALGWAGGGVIIAAGYPLALALSPSLSLLLRISSHPLMFSILLQALASLVGGAVGSSSMVLVIARHFPSAISTVRSRVRVVLLWAVSLLVAQLASGALFAVLVDNPILQAPFSFLGLLAWQPVFLLLLLEPLAFGAAAFTAASATLIALDKPYLPTARRAPLMEAALWGVGASIAHAAMILTPEIMPSAFSFYPYGGSYDITAFVLLGASSHALAALIGAPLSLRRLRSCPRAR